jgi:hypothetical protein
MATIQPFMSLSARDQAKEAARQQLLGDRLASGLQKLGADRIAKTFTAVTGKPCGCDRRTARLNAWDVARKERTL